MSEFNLDTNEQNIQLNNNESSEIYVTLISSENTKYKIPVNILSISNMINVMVDNDSDEDMPLFNVNDKCLTKIIEFMKYYHNDKMNNIEKPLKSSDLKQIIQEWYADFIDVDQDFLFKLIKAANYLDIQPLLNLGCAKVASSIKNKTPEEIREIFNINN